MSIKNDIREQIKSAIRHFDFEDAISTAMESIDIEEMVSQKISRRITCIWPCTSWRQSIRLPPTTTITTTAWVRWRIRRP